MSRKIRVLVVDDSALMRKLIPQILERDRSIEVVGTAMDGSFALQKIEELQPDVVTLDIEMPRMDGLETLRHITRRYRLPAIMVSAQTTDGAAATFRALAQGAFDFVAKPRDAASVHMDQVAQELINKIKCAGSVKPVALGPAKHFPEPSRAKKPATRPEGEPTRVVVIGISTGGPNALQSLLAQLPGDFPAAIAVVQHMPEGFTEMFARRLNESCALDVKEAQSGDLLVPGRALICPGNRHMRFRHTSFGETVVLTDDERVNGHRPSVDVLFRSAAREFGPKAIGVIMTGMGEDGAEALGVIKAVGGLTVAQDESTCVVFGMPKAAIERGYAMRILPLEAIANTLIRHASSVPVPTGV